MIIERTMHPTWLSNTWLVADQPGGHAVLIDTGGPDGQILAWIEELRLTVTHVLCTHHHYDHVAHNADYRARFGCPICGHHEESELFDSLDRELSNDEEIRCGDLCIRAVHIPGHTLGQLAFIVNDGRVFTGDTLFRGSVGGTRAPGHTSFEDIQHSIMDVLMTLPHDMRVYPGHCEETTIGREWETNPFIRTWRGADSAEDKPCVAFGRPATLLLQARDYDDGTKCWVRFTDTGELDIVPGSRVAVSV